MGMFKQLKNLAGVAKQAPGMIEDARRLQQQTQQMQAAGQIGQFGGPAVMGVPQPADVAAGDPRLAPIEGVTLERYAQVSKVAATRGLDQAGLNAYVASLGIDPAVWNRATEGWNARFKGDMRLATQFGRIYQQAQV